jgi:HEPN domain-containing protein
VVHPGDTHSLDELIRLAIESDEEFGNIAAAKKLDQYYIPTRYPNGLPGGVPSRYYDDPAEAEQAMRLARGLIELVREKVGAPDRGSTGPIP